MNNKEIPVFSWDTKKEEFCILGHKFDGVNSIEDFIEFIENLKKENELLKQLKAKIIDGDDDIKLTYDLGDYLSSIDCCLGQNSQICDLKKENEQLKVSNQHLQSRLEMQKDSNKLLCKAIMCDNCDCDTVCEAHKQQIKLQEQFQSKKQELNGFVTTISEYLEFEEPEHTTYDEIIEKIVNLKGSAIKLQQRDEVIKKTRNKLGRYADEMVSNGNAYAICVDLLDTLNIKESE